MALSELQPFDGDVRDGAPVLDEEEGVLAVFKRLQLVIGADTDAGEGSLYVTDGRIIWLSDTTAAAPPSSSGGAEAAEQQQQRHRGYSVAFPAISMHAVATDAESFNKPCLYLQLDSGEEEPEAGGSGGEEEEEGSEAASIAELRLIPADPGTLDELFKALCEGAERNPDAADGDEEGGGFFFDRDAALAGAAGAALGLGDVEELLGDDPGRFEDAADEEGEEDEDQFEEFEQQQQPNGALR